MDLAITMVLDSIPIGATVVSIDLDGEGLMDSTLISADSVLTPISEDLGSITISIITTSIISTAALAGVVAIMEIITAAITATLIITLDSTIATLLTTMGTERTRETILQVSTPDYPILEL